MKTALITGASEGIGQEFARIFARRGNNLILVARNEKRLVELSGELSADKINVKIYALDLSRLENAEFIYNDLKKSNIQVDFLVNNAGFGINGIYTDISWNNEMEMYNLNMITLAYFTKMFAKDMKERGFGRILNIGSTGSFQPGPFMAGYCATKAFVLSLSEAVNYELKDSGVSVTTLCPGVTDTRFHAVAKTEKTAMSRLLSHASAEEVAGYGYKLMMKGKSLGVQGLMNKIVVMSTRFGSRRVITAVSGRLLKA